MKSLISPWQNVSIDDDFGHDGFGIETDSSRILWGPFAVLDCNEKSMTEKVIKEWIQFSDTFTIDIRDISEGEGPKIWQWFSNRDHRLEPDREPVFENRILKCKTSSGNINGKATHRNYWFRLPNENEWQQLAPGVSGEEERFKYVLTTYYGWG